MPTRCERCFFCRPLFPCLPPPTLSGANVLYHEGPHARQRWRRAPVSERTARRVNGEYIAKARTLDHEHSRQVDGTRRRATQACVSRCR